MAPNRDIQSLLLKLKLISPERLERVKEELEEDTGGKTDIGLVNLLIDKNLISKDQIIPVVEFCFGINYIDLSTCNVDIEAVKIITEVMAKKYKCISTNIENGKLHVIMADPLNLVAQEDIRLSTGYELEIGWDFYSNVDNTVNAYYISTEMASKAVEEIEQEELETEEPDEEENVDVSRAPVVRLVNSILSQAVQRKASDIHIEPGEKEVLVRFRIDGELNIIMKLPKNSHSAIVTRIKIISALDIAEKRLPQDGRVAIKVDNRPIDLRVSLLPTVFGEKAVLRILDRSNVLVTIDKLGFTEQNISRFDQLIKSPEGMILISGPTGSGKSTTLYAVLSELNRPEINIITVEDPVEYRIDGIHQVQVNAKAGLTFATGLRSILRQDPDVIMVGEIRDTETAEIASRAAITGHVVLSTIHTNDATSSIYRLEDMGIELFMIASSLMGVVAQRLVKKLCTHCRYEREAEPNELIHLGLNNPVKIYDANGCNRCGGTGYSGRTAIHEVLVMDREIRAMVLNRAPSGELKDRAREKGMLTLKDSCQRLVLEGITSVSEMNRVTYNIDD